MKGEFHSTHTLKKNEKKKYLKIFLIVRNMKITFMNLNQTFQKGVANI